MMRSTANKKGIYSLVIEPLIKGILIFILTGSVLASLASFIWYRNNVVRLANEVHQLSKQTRELAANRDDLNARILQLENYSRILRITSEKLKMKPAVDKPLIFEVPESDFQKIREKQK